MRAIRSHPDAIATICEDRVETYAQAGERIQGLADFIAALDGDAPVAVAGTGTPGVWHAIMAAAVAGVPWVPIDARQPRAVAEHMIRDSGARVCIGFSAEAAQTVGAVCEYVDGTKLPPARVTGECARAHASPADISYIIYTSGSTGPPKGVVIGEDAIAGFLGWIADHERIDPTDRVLQSHSIGFDNSIWEMFCPLAGGAAIVFANVGEPPDFGDLVRTIERERVTVVNATARQAAALVGVAEMLGLSPFGSVRRLYVGAETVTREAASRILAAMPPTAQVANEYGPTEATITCTLGAIPPAALTDGAASASMPIGWAIGDAVIEVRDEEGRLVPTGEVGALWVSGRCLALEYLNLPEETASHFVDDPWDEGDGSRWYRTGDVVQVTDAGYVFLGRTDKQVKVRGHRIEPAAIEALAGRLPNVRQAAVVPVGGVPGAREGIWLFVVTHEGASHEVDAIRATLREHLPYYMTPDRIIMRRDPLPLTVNGKLDAALLLASARRQRPR